VEQMSVLFVDPCLYPGIALRFHWLGQNIRI
jgi:hypothetical protein